MVEFLRRSVEQLEPPVCPACHIAMTWYRSLRPPGETRVIVHFFQCTNCNGIAEITAKVRGNGAGQKPPPQGKGARSTFAAPLPTAFAGTNGKAASRPAPPPASPHRACK